MSEYRPTFSPRTRTAVYVVCLVVPVLTTLALTLLAVFDVIDNAKAAAVVGAVGMAAAAIAGGMGVAYRPTRADIAPSGVPITTTGRPLTAERIADAIDRGRHEA